MVETVVMTLVIVLIALRMMVLMLIIHTISLFLFLVPVIITRDSCTRPVPLNSITVSKKRNWLNQTLTRPSPPSDEDDHNHPPQARTQTQPHTHTPDVPTADPAEENDADDEGEIWYNPIPEDEEVELHHGERGARVRRGTSGGEGGKSSATSKDLGNMNASHSSEQKHVYRQMCKSQEEKLTVRPTATGTGFSLLVFLFFLLF